MNGTEAAKAKPQDTTSDLQKTKQSTERHAPAASTVAYKIIKLVLIFTLIEEILAISAYVGIEYGLEELKKCSRCDGKGQCINPDYRRHEECRCKSDYPYGTAKSSCRECNGSGVGQTDERQWLPCNKCNTTGINW